MPTIGHRIKEARTRPGKKRTQQALADYVGVSREAVSQWESGDVKSLKPENLVRTADFLEVDIRQLVFGRIAGTRKELGRSAPPLVFVDWHKDVRLGAGQGIESPSDGEVDQLGFREDWMRAKGWKPESIRAATAMGRSMEPRIQDGDLLLIHLADKTVRNGKVYAIREATGDRVKRLFMRYDGALRIVSDNPSAEFSEEVVPADKLAHIEIIGRVVWIGGSV